MNALSTSLHAKRILITGGLGFIGSNLAHRCVYLGGEVTVYDNLAPNSGGNLYNVESIRDDIDLVIGDICNYDQLVQAVISKDIVINCAASTSHPSSMREPWLNLDVNSRGVINTLEAMRLVSRDAKLVHIGTSTQLGKLNYQPADELHSEFPLDVYSANKVVSEKYVLLYSQTYGLRATVIRVSNVYGPRAAIHSPEFTFNNYFVGLAMQGKAITVYRPGEQLRNVVFVQDVVDAVLAAVGADTTIGETFFAVSDEHHSIRKIAEDTASAMGGHVELIEWPESRKSIEVGDAVLSNAKIQKTIGWSPSVNFREGLELTKAFYDRHLNEYLM